MNFDHIVNDYRRYLWQNNYSKNTLKSYTGTIKKLFKNQDLEKISQKDLDKIAVGLRDKYALGSNRMRYAAINLFCKEILKRKELYLKIPKSRSKNKDILTHEEIEKILRIAQKESKIVQAVIQTLYHCALRRSELCNLNLEDINFDTMEISIRDAKTGDRIVSMTTKVVSALQEYIMYERRPKQTDEKALFVNKFGKRIGEHFIRNHLKDCASEAQISRNVYPHILRASCITHLLNKGINPLTVQNHAGHRDFRTTMMYNRPTQQQMKSQIEKAFVIKSNMTNEERAKAVFDKYLRGEISINEMNKMLEVMRPKELNSNSDFTGYV
ncbi:MAG: tyrosine-type recombinase/integrase [Candidatus Thermoplasmatota archaeon]|nr:tyrosine-type recombinase/integrase [Candidatus Thermoplasmatota archaeon]